MTPMPLARAAAMPAALALALALPGRLAAQAPSDSIGWHFVGTLGYVQTSGNTKLSTINVGDKLFYRPSRSWLFTQNTTYIRGKSAGALSANQLLAGLRADYSISTPLAAFGRFTYEANPFAGLSHRLEEVVGLTWKALATPRATLNVDVGVGQTQERTGGADNSFATARLSPTYRHTFQANSYFEEAVELVANLKDTDDLRLRSQTTLVAPLSSRIALGFGLLVLYDAQPAPLPLPAVGVFEKTDLTFTAGLQITL